MSARELQGYLATCAILGLGAACGSSERATQDGSSGSSSVAGASGMQPGGAAGNGTGGVPGTGGSMGNSGGSGHDLPKTLLHAGEVTLYGVTSDGFVIFYSSADSTTRAAPIRGGTADVIYGSAGSLTIRGKVVFIAPNSDDDEPFTVWTSASGVHSLEAGGPPRNVYSGAREDVAADDAGTRIVFSNGLDGVVRWTGANVDLSGAVDIAPVGMASCAKAFYAAGHFVTTACPESGMYTLDSWDAGWQRFPQHAGPGLNLTYDRVKVAGENIVFTLSTQLMWAPVAGLPSQVAGSASVFLVAPDGERVAYHVVSGNIAQASPVRSPAPVDVDVDLLFALEVFFSPDGSYLASHADGGSARYARASGGEGVELTPGVGSILLARGFTHDSRYVLYGAAGDGMYAAPVSGDAPVQIASLPVYQGPSILAAAGGDRVVYADPVEPRILARDLDSATEPVVVAEGTGFVADLVLSAEMSMAVYVAREGDDPGGLYAIGIPKP